MKKRSKGKILVIGDLMVDKYIFGKINGISYEAPIPLVEVNQTEMKIGGAGNVIENAALLGASVYVVGVIGNDNEGKMIKDNLKKMKINSQGVITDKKIKTLVRSRVIVENHQISRFDEAGINLHGAFEKKIKILIKKILPKVNCIIICDYGKGLINKNIIDIIKRTKNKKS